MIDAEGKEDEMEWTRCLRRLRLVETVYLSTLMVSFTIVVGDSEGGYLRRKTQSQTS